MAEPSNPASCLSVVFSARGTLANNRKTLDCLISQTIAAHIELIVICDDPDLLREIEDVVSSSGCFSRCVFLVRTGSTMGRHRLHAAAQATADAVVFTEDHAYPENNWAEELVEAFASSEHILAAAPLLLNLNPGTVVSRVQFLLNHGSHQAARSSDRFEECKDLPWHSTAYRREVFTTALLDGGDDIFLQESFLQERLRRIHPAARLVRCNRARTHHGNMSRLYPAMIFAYHGGRSFGAVRSRLAGWRPAERVTRTLLFPAVAILAILRAAPFLWDDRSLLRTTSHFLVAVPVAFFHAMGEAVGTCCGVGDSEHAYEAYEYHRLSLIREADRYLFLSNTDAARITCHREAAQAGWNF